VGVAGHRSGVRHPLRAAVNLGLRRFDNNRARLISSTIAVSDQNVQMD
jgi:hypothetical protein